jgi:hypothetical protein
MFKVMHLPKTYSISGYTLRTKHIATDDIPNS